MKITGKLLWFCLGGPAFCTKEGGQLSMWTFGWKRFRSERFWLSLRAGNCGLEQIQIRHLIGIYFHFLSLYYFSLFFHSFTFFYYSCCLVFRISVSLPSFPFLFQLFVCIMHSSILTLHYTLFLHIYFLSFYSSSF